MLLKRRIKNLKKLKILCDYCHKELWRSQGELNKHKRRGLKHIFCLVCALQISKKRFQKWNKENNPKEWHRKTALKGSNHHSYKGITRRKDGYFRITIETNNRRLFHRFVMEKIIKRPLAKDEIIHHRDGNPSNNSIDNLMITNRQDHARLHNTIKN